jgi:Putative regulator of cell autolysis
LFFEYSRKRNITVKEEVNLLDQYLQVEKMRFEDKLEYSISVDDSIDIDEQLIPSMILQPIVENAVNHGLFHKKKNGTVTIGG